MTAVAPKVRSPASLPPNYKWTALANTTAAVFIGYGLATVLGKQLE